jgi:hypothetical protein
MSVMPLPCIVPVVAEIGLIAIADGRVAGRQKRGIQRERAPEKAARKRNSGPAKPRRATVFADRTSRPQAAGLPL